MKSYLVTVVSQITNSDNNKFQERVDIKSEDYIKGYMKAVKDIFPEHQSYCQKIPNEN